MFQSDCPMLQFLCDEVHNIILALMFCFVKTSNCQREANTIPKLCQIHCSSSSKNILEYKNINVGFEPKTLFSLLQTMSLVCKKCHSKMAVIYRLSWGLLPLLIMYSNRPNVVLGTFMQCQNPEIVLEFIFHKSVETLTKSGYAVHILAIMIVPIILYAGYVCYVV